MTISRGMRLALIGSAGACHHEGPAERAGKKVDETVEKAQEKAHDAAEKAKDKAQDLEDKAEDATD
jgi:hypothetical protein